MDYMISHAPDLVAAYWADKGGPTAREEARLGKRMAATKKKATTKKPTKGSSIPAAEESEPAEESIEKRSVEVKRFRISSRKPEVISASKSPEIRSPEIHNKRPLEDKDEDELVENISKRARKSSEAPESPSSINQTPEPVMEKEAVEAPVPESQRSVSQTPEPETEETEAPEPREASRSPEPTTEKESPKAVEEPTDTTQESAVEEEVENVTVSERGEEESNVNVEGTVPSNERVSEPIDAEVISTITTNVTEKAPETKSPERILPDNEDASRLEDSREKLLEDTTSLIEEANEIMDIDIPVDEAGHIDESSEQDETLSDKQQHAKEIPETVEEPKAANVDKTVKEPEQNEEEEIGVLEDIENIQLKTDKEATNIVEKNQTPKAPSSVAEKVVNVVEQMEGVASAVGHAITEATRSSSQVFRDYVQSANESQTITIEKNLMDLTPEDVVFDENYPHDPSDWDTKVVAVEAMVRQPNTESNDNLYGIIRW